MTISHRRLCATGSAVICSRASSIVAPTYAVRTAKLEKPARRAPSYLSAFELRTVAPRFGSLRSTATVVATATALK
eukprot:CAMPEP_0185837202 /NCGR_PEP_ID=MMETSP1353-20130828/10990_1 /TAXON_ID=1077150 /ORGANISM="Erythrolobus australicus, Strain CCMP3124" /LENGTH=75 /DNA_ID=CAMNT_0028536091 /DNA_START=209 /DNA_END=436 /DNA_ORIENTATION=+